MQILRIGFKDNLPHDRLILAIGNVYYSVVRCIVNPIKTSMMSFLCLNLCVPDLKLTQLGISYKRLVELGVI